MLDRLQFLFNEAFVALRRNFWMTFAAITTVAVSLFLLGGFVYVLLSVNSFAATIPGRMDMRVFLRPGTSTAEIQKTAAALRSVPGVAQANWIPRDKAWAKYGEQYPELTKGIENPFPDAFKVTIKELKDGDSVAAAIRKLPAVDPQDGVQYLRETVELLDQATQLTRWLGTVLGGLLLLTGGILIYNTTRLTVIARKTEIRIMQLVGASPLTIRLPFYLEGVVHGFVGGLLAAVLLWGAQEVVQSRIGMIDATVKLSPFPLTLGLVSLALAGAVYGMLCAVFAVRTPLRST